MTSGQDMNGSIGSRENKSCKQIGPRGINNRNAKGAEAVNLLRMHDLYAPLTFYCHKEKVIWSSFDGKNTKFQLYQWITNSINNIQDYKVINYGVPSDHSAIKMNLKFENIVENEMKKMDDVNWNLFLDDDIKVKFNEKNYRNN